MISYCHPWPAEEATSEPNEPLSGISSGPCYGILPSGEVSYLMQSLQDTYSPWPRHSFLGPLPGQLRCFYFAWWWPALSPVLCEPPQWKLLTPCSSCLGVKFCMYVCACVQLLQSCLSLQPYRLAHQAPLTADFSRQEYWSGLLCPPPGDLPHPGIKARSPALQVGSLSTEPPGKA